MLGPQLNHMVHNNQLASFTIIKVKKHVSNQIGQQTKKVVVIMEVEIVAPGNQVGAKVGNPVQLNTDGKIVEVPQSQNSNPIAGVPLKRIAGPGGADQPPVKTVPGQTRSLVTPRSATSTEKFNVQPIESITPFHNSWTIKAR